MDSYGIRAILLFCWNDIPSNISRLRENRFKFWHGVFCKLLSRPIDKIKMTWGRGRWPRDLRKSGWFSCALLSEKSVCVGHLLNVVISVDDQRRIKHIFFCIVVYKEPWEKAKPKIINQINLLLLHVLFNCGPLMHGIMNQNGNEIRILLQSGISFHTNRSGNQSQIMQIQHQN